MDIIFLIYHILNIIFLIILQITFGLYYNKKYLYKHLCMLIIYVELKNINISIKSINNFIFITLIKLILTIDYTLKNYKYILKLCL